MVGEAAISTATLCFGDSMTGNNGHSDLDVLYIAFQGTEAVPGASGAKWDATSADEFQSSVEALGSKLLAKIGAASDTSATLGSLSGAKASVTKSPGLQPTSSAASPSGSAVGNAAGGDESCSWEGHCEGKLGPSEPSATCSSRVKKTGRDSLSLTSEQVLHAPVTMTAPVS